MYTHCILVQITAFHDIHSKMAMATSCNTSTCILHFVYSSWMHSFQLFLCMCPAVWHYKYTSSAVNEESHKKAGHQRCSILRMKL
jgi:hypothetical protein